MLPETCRKLKAFVILAMLSVSEGRRVSSRILLSGLQSDGSAFNADDGAEEGVYNEHERLETHPQVTEQSKLSKVQQYAKLAMENPIFQKTSETFAELIEAINGEQTGVTKGKVFSLVEVGEEFIPPPKNIITGKFIAPLPVPSDGASRIALPLAISSPAAFLVPSAAPRAVVATPLARAPALRMAVDYPQIAKYPIAIAGQVALIGALFKGIDSLVTLPTFCVPLIFLFLSLRSRVFSFLPAQRPNRAEQDGNATPSEIKRPSWTPPGIAFPFIWITISCLRAASSTLIWRSTGRHLFTPPLLTLILHLCVGDAWNCVTNVERRMGTSALGVIGVLASVYFAVGVYYKTRPLAGLLLAPSACWISIASILTWRIWQMNGREPLLPQREDGKAVPLRVPLSNVMKA